MVADIEIEGRPTCGLEDAVGDCFWAAAHVLHHDAIEQEVRHLRRGLGLTQQVDAHHHLVLQHHVKESSRGKLGDM